MWKSRGYTHLVPCITAVIIAAATACSSSTSPNSGKTVPPGSAAKGDKIDLTGTYNLASFTRDSSGNTSSTPVDANDGGTLVLTSSAFTLTWTGTFAANNGGNGNSGTYVATDTSSSADQGTLALTSTKSQNGTYNYSAGTLTITLPNGSGTVTNVTVWIKQ
ncbi:MAG TPA: hypothetical protein VNW46_03870 [Gemmatimonadaceae bacterium]|jgi:hypothetical protein|nr:hypothetical protein [Gemmatimonadaceae bacterium]